MSVDRAYSYLWVKADPSSETGMLAAAELLNKHGRQGWRVISTVMSSAAWATNYSACHRDVIVWTLERSGPLGSPDGGRA